MIKHMQVSLLPNYSTIPCRKPSRLPKNKCGIAGFTNPLQTRQLAKKTGGKPCRRRRQPRCTSPPSALIPPKQAPPLPKLNPQPKRLRTLGRSPDNGAPADASPPKPDVSSEGAGEPAARTLSLVCCSSCSVCSCICARLRASFAWPAGEGRGR